LADIHWYTLKEQLVMGRLIDREPARPSNGRSGGPARMTRSDGHLDLVHFPHWNVPLFLRTPFVVTIHDLILLEEPRSARATTRHPFIYAIKYAAYKVILKHALTKSSAIIAVSQYTKSSILKFFPKIPASKIHVIYEGLTTFPPSPTNPPHPPNPFLLYVGNAYPHKNLETLLNAFSLFRESHPGVHLVLAGRGDVFYERLQKEVARLNLTDCVRFVLNPTDQDLAELYRVASLYVFPSRCEGFGLPPLEAMSFGVPVVVSRTSSLPEILGDAAVYFDPKNPDEIAQTLGDVFDNPSLQETLRKKGLEQIKRYSWKKMAEEILHVYESCDQKETT
ncbi:MAG: glycosyltransferase family 1 protein, partial [Patescibacteria group bacterium]